MRRPRVERMCWWGYVVVLTLILGSTATSVVTGNPLFALVFIPIAWYISTRVPRARRSRRRSRKRPAGIGRSSVQFVTEKSAAFLRVEGSGHARVISL